MWRFILLTFAFLGWSFYELSGGADYQPAANSIQAQAKTGKISPVPRPGSTRTAHLVEEAPLTPELPEKIQATIARNGSDQASDPVAGQEYQITLASVQVADVSLPTTTVETHETKTTVLTDPGETVQSPAEPTDLRFVTGNVVNMRSGPGTSFGKVAKLTKGTKVTVLRDPGEGWLKLKVVETGKIGWMADWLVTNAAY